MSSDAIHYPLAGFVYLLTSPSMWGTVLCVALLGITVALMAIILLFTIALQPQAALFGGGRWWSYMLAVVAVLFEALLLTVVMLKVVHSKCQKRIFLETMQQEERWLPDMEEPAMVRDCNCCKLGLFVKIISFPLNLIPVAGTIIYAFINAPFEAWDLMDMYFDAIGMDNHAQMVEVSGGHNQSWDGMYASSNYVRFGFVAMLLETIPILGPAIFSLSNACGAALWACEMQAEGGPPTLRQDSKTATLV
jgi:uncharacterized protein involved in cysteine biosynthesis